MIHSFPETGTRCAREEKKSTNSKTVIIVPIVNIVKKNTRSSCATKARLQHLQECHCALLVKKTPKTFKQNTLPCRSFCNHLSPGPFRTGSSTWIIKRCTVLTFHCLLLYQVLKQVCFVSLDIFLPCAKTTAFVNQINLMYHPSLVKTLRAAEM